MYNFPNNYNHKQIEENWRNFWDKNKTYAWDSNQEREYNFVIDTPPPTVSGTLHMGHVFSYTQTDFIARYQRMKGMNVFYPMGFDNNGLPTERLVEKVKQVRANSMERSEFIKTCQEVVESALDDFRSLFKSLALSVDWSQEYQTISPLSRKLSQLSFLDLLSKKDCYRKLEPCLWDVVDQTALAQADIVDLELKSHMNEIIFYSESNEKLHIATTRPELLAACVAVFYHPEDKRFAHLKNSFAYTPLFGIKVPLIADDKVDVEKGTGLVMCCTFGDTTDVEWWKEHNLPTRIIFDKRGKLTNILDIINSNLVEKDFENSRKYAEELANLKINEARSRTLELLKEKGLLVKQEEITRAVKCAERSGSPLEILITYQWFIKTLDKKEDLLKRAKESNWHPNYMQTRLENWITGLNWDWCISRQRYFGVPFPVWYSKRKGEEGKTIIADISQLPVDPLNDLPVGYSRDEVEPDYDVMDTWATSSISPQLNSHAISKEYFVDLERHKKLFPADLRPQAHEIIRTWTFYTMLKAHIHEQTIPWKNLMISGWCLAADKTKMSKSKGNVVTPINLIEEKGVDIVRYWASNSRLGADIAYSEEVFALGKKLVNKIWNAAKFANIHISKLTKTPTTIDQDIKENIIFEPIDLWILEKLQSVIKNSSYELEQFEYCIARSYVEEFFWKDYCDNYIEIVKARAYDESGNNYKGQMSAIYTIFHCLNNLLKLFAPYLPHITEEIYQVIFAKNNESIHALNMWPAQIENSFNKNDLQSANIAIVILDAVRKIKADKQISIKTPIEVLAISENSKELLDLTVKDLSSVINALDIKYTNNFDSDFINLDNNIKIKASFNL